MESLDFVLIVIPLSVIVVTLTTLVYYYANREEINKRKSAKTIQGFLEKRVKQQAAIQTELSHLDQMYKSRSINESIYQRLQNVLLMTQEKQRFEAIMTLNETNGMFKKETETTLEKIPVENEDVSMEQETLPEEQEVDKVELEETPKAKTPKRKRIRKVQAGKKKALQKGLIDGDIARKSITENEHLISKN